jgi:hypothetical protein
MARETRTLVVLAVLAVGGVVALDLMARRYTDLLDPGDPGEIAAAGADAEADRLVEQYVRVREALAESASAADTEAALTRALAAHGLGRTAWMRVEAMHRQWAAGRAVAPAFAAAFDARRDRLR